VLAEQAFAKVNLTLRVIRRRPDGYHDLDSLVVFARLADALSVTPGDALGLTVQGPTAVAAGPDADNLVLKAAAAASARFVGLKLGHFTLVKRLPVAAGLGGGSADAAAALRLIAQVNGLAIDDPRLAAAAQATGADVPVCLDPRPRRMSGIGDVLSPPLALPELAAVLVNPGVAVPTKAVFAALDRQHFDDRDAACWWETEAQDHDRLVAALAASGNDLEPAAIKLQPVIGEVLAALAAVPGCRLARMSGSGATCFALFDAGDAAEAAARSLAQDHPDWWVQATTLGAPPR
jgi:4-diphosphocytidyl-2-C-methyl-D-erythritol kinase